MPRKLIVLLTILISSYASAQDTLPRFSVVSKGSDRIIISWTNLYGNSIKQLSIQRSFDSLKNFKTILTVPDPTVTQNGYVDSKATNDHMFYRLYIQLDSGKYRFSAVRRPGNDSGFQNTAFITTLSAPGQGIVSMNKVNELIDEAKKRNERVIFIKKRDVLLGAIPETFLKRFRDSVNYNSRDTLYMNSSDTIYIRSFNPRDYFRPSKYVFTEKDGNVKIALDDAASANYAIKFFEDDNTEAFEIKRIREPLVILDKTNFVHSGWFSFELYEDGKLKERHKFYIPKDF